MRALSCGPFGWPGLAWPSAEAGVAPRLLTLPFAQESQLGYGGQEQRVARGLVGLGPPRSRCFCPSPTAGGVTGGTPKVKLGAAPKNT